MDAIFTFLETGLGLERVMAIQDRGGRFLDILRSPLHCLGTIFGHGTGDSGSSG